VWTEATLGKITGGALADAQAAAEGGDYFKAVLALLAVVVAEVIDEKGVAETDRAQVKTIVREMPSIDAEYLSTEALSLSGGEDYIEGIYRCPRPGCDGEIISEGDGADKISDLETVYAEEPDEPIDMSLASPVRIVNTRTGALLVDVTTLVLRQPVVRDYIRAFSKVGMKDQLRYQYAAYAEAILLVNEEKVDDKWRNTWGSFVFEKMERADLSEVGRRIRSKGLQTRLPKTCPKCGKRWDAEVSTAGFFASKVAPRG
jgi:hypothetical protein